MNCPHCAAPNTEDARFCGTCGRAASATEPTSHPHLNAPGSEVSLIGREIAGRYRIEAKLGEGGMGAVYKAQQTSLKRAVAIKLLRPEVASSQPLLRRFNAEAELVAKLSHPNTVNIYDFGQDRDGTLFIAMEYIEGTSLRHVIHKDAPLPLRRMLGIAQQIAASLTDAHATSIVHRDLKPDNVMLQERGRQKDVVRVLDFGIAKLRDENRQSQLAMTQAGDMLGTPQYMAPEQIRAEQIDGRTDVYALGCMMFEMITGRLPFEGPTVMSLLSKHLLEAPSPPSQRRPDLQIPPAIDQLVMSAMAKDPAARPATMELLGEQIAQLLASLPVDTQSVTSQVVSAAQPVVTPPPAAYAPPSAPYHPVPAYDPRSYPPPPAPVAAPARRGSGATMWIILAVVLLAIAGTGVYVAVVRKPSATPPVPADAAVAHDDSEDAEDDPWAVKDPPSAPGRIPTVQGVEVVLPPGFTVSESDAVTFTANDPRGVSLTVVALARGLDNPDKIAEQYARSEDLTIASRDNDMIAGAQRRVFSFVPRDGRFTEVGTAIIGPGHRVAIVFHIPIEVAQADPSVGAAAIAFFNSVHVP